MPNIQPKQEKKEAVKIHAFGNNGGDGSSNFTLKIVEPKQEWEETEKIFYEWEEIIDEISNCFEGVGSFHAGQLRTILQRVNDEAEQRKVEEILLEINSILPATSRIFTDKLNISTLKEALTSQINK